MRGFAASVLALWLILVVGAPATAASTPTTISGKVTYAEKIPLPPSAHLVVRLIDTARHDTHATVSANAPIAATGKLPLSFTLRFNPGLVIPSHLYGLDIAITSNGQTWFRTSNPYPVDPLDPTADPTITVHFAGTVTNMPTRLESATPASPESLIDVHWRAIRLAGAPLPKTPEMTLLITPDLRAGGRGGCNSYFAQAALDGHNLAFSAVAATRMMCAAPIMTNETAFFDALPTVATYMVNSGTLTLFDATGTTVATLVRSAE
jgi:putative lipoprotein